MARDALHNNAACGPAAVAAAGALCWRCLWGIFYPIEEKKERYNGIPAVLTEFLEQNLAINYK